MSKKLPTVWTANEHTKAKIAILKGYLDAWFRILGTTKKGQLILYVDGFAGPGRYTNHEEGSPLAAISAASGAIDQLGGALIARGLHCAFIEKDHKRYEMLKDCLAPHQGRKLLGISHYECEFVEGIEAVRKAMPGPFKGDGPLFVFADPFGGTGIPFKTFATCMSGDASELLINLDADGIGRIFKADNNKREEQLTGVFGDESWRDTLSLADPLPQTSLKILNLYKQRLRTLSGVKYIWSFAMRSGNTDSLNYHLVFASKHPLGLKKMKEAMKKLDQTGTYSFSDAHIDQHALFKEDNEVHYADSLWRVFDGKTVSYDEVDTYALNETPFLNAKALLRNLEGRKMVNPILHVGAVRKKGDFGAEKIHSLRFGAFSEPTLF